jgi:NmrA-like family
VHAIFAVTNFWEHLFTGKTQDQSGEIEEEQAMKLARAAAKTSTLEHYIWSTLPAAKALTGGKFPVPHLDYKANVDHRIRKELPQLAKKTTYLYFGFYPSNMAFFPMMKPLEVVFSSQCPHPSPDADIYSRDHMASTFGCSRLPPRRLFLSLEI